MEYKKITFTIEPDSEINREILTAKLGEIGFESFTEKDEYTEAYIQSGQFSENLISSKSFSDFPFFSYDYSVETIPDQNWNEIWEKNYFKPLLINEECLIRAPFHTEYPKAPYEIVIDPRMAFGTGNHETTYLMISEILDLNLTDKKILDMGCGTGVLSILASLKGAREITAIDIDENAYHITLENIKYNNIFNIIVQFGGAELLNAQKYEFIFANIQRNVLVQDLPSYTKALDHGGILIMSGFYPQDLKVIQEKAESLGLIFKSSNEKNNWMVSTFIRE